MNILLAGLARQSGSAVEYVAGALWPGVRFVRLGGPAEPWPQHLPADADACALCVVDLLGLSGTRYSERAAAEVEQLLAGRGAVLIAPSGDGGGWLALDGQSANRVVLQPPLSVVGLRDALQRAGPPSPTSTHTPPPRAMPRHFGQAASTLPADIDPAFLPTLQPDDGDVALAPVMRTTPGTGNATHRSSTPSSATSLDSVPGTLERAMQARPVPRLATLVPRDASGHTMQAAPLAAMSHSTSAWPAAGTHSATRSAPSPVLAPMTPPVVVRVAEALTTRTAVPPSADREPHGHTAETLAATPMKATRPLSTRGFAAVTAAYPSLAGTGFLHLVIDIVTSGKPHEVRIASKSGAVFHPAEGWVCSNIPIVLRDGLLRHELMVKTVTSRAIAESDVRERALPLYGRRRDALRPLDAFIWTLANTALERSPPPAVGNLRFRLRRFPNFTRLRPVPEDFYRLAIYALRGTQSVRSLKRAFPEVEPTLIDRFALCAVLSGLARVREKSPTDNARRRIAVPASTERASPVAAGRAGYGTAHGSLPDANDSSLDDDLPPPQAAHGKRGFFKAMIQRLF